MASMPSTPRGENAPTGSAIGRLLRQWRERRRLSQLALAVEAEVSARHLSFVETGRAQPSRELVLLLAAGYAPIYRETSLEAPEMAQVRRALDFMLRQQEPYPALVLDGHWNILMSNEATGRLMGLFLDPAAAAAVGPPNAMRLTYHPRGLRPFIVNWEATAAALYDITLHELRVECFFPADGASEELMRRLARESGAATRTS